MVFNSRHFGTLCLFHLHRCVDAKWVRIKIFSVVNRYILSCVTFWVVLQLMVFNSRCFGTLCLFHLHKRVDAKWVRIEICSVVNRYILSCVTFWVVLRSMVFNSRRFGTLCLFHLHRQVDTKWMTKEISFIIHFASTCLWRWNRHSVPKRPLLNTVRCRPTQKVTHEIQNTVKAWNQEYIVVFHWINLLLLFTTHNGMDHIKLEVMSASVYTGLNLFNVTHKHFLQICLWVVSYEHSYCSF
jgi:ribosomal protein S19